MGGNTSGPTSTSTHLRIPPAMEALQTELRNHPQLMAELRIEEAAGRCKTFEDCLAIIASHVDVVLHGMYGGNEIADMCAMLHNKLVEKRQPLA